MRKFTALMLCLLMAAGQLWAQNRALKGRVVDEKGNPIANASVIVKGTTNGTTTNADGNFSITVPETAKTLVITSLNFVSQEIGIGSITNFSISLKSSVNDIEEVVVTGYSRVKKSQYSGTVSRVGGEQIRNVPIASFDQILQGKVPGLTVLNGSGQPGNAANVILRGPTSILGGSTPLYILDGVPVEAAVFQSINPNDFESVEVLKDGISMAQYGNRGAAGVIVATTKRGASGKARLIYSGQMGMKSKPTFNYEMMTAGELLSAQEKLGLILPGSAASLPGWQNSKLNPAYIAGTSAQKAQFDRNIDSLTSINTNWDDLYFRNAMFQNHELSLSGSVGKARIFSNISYYTEEGLISRSDMKRVTVRNNFDYGDDKLNFRISTLLGYTKRNFQESTTSNGLTNPFLVTRITPSYISLYKADGTYNLSTAQPYFGVNLLQAMDFNQNQSDQIKITLGTDVTYKISKDFNFGLQTGLDFRETQGTVYRDTRSFLSYSSTNLLTRSGLLQETLTRNLQMNVRPYLTYQHVFNTKHEVEVSANGEYLRNFGKGLNFTAYGTDPKRPNTPGAVTPGTVTNQLIPLAGGNRTQRTIMSGFAIGRYTFNKKYTINATVRRDGTSSLPEANRFQTFYGVGGVWDITRESFLQNNKSISTLRLKGSYGQAANVDNFPLGNFGYLPTYTQGAYEGLNTLVTSGAGNPDADWEYTNTSNIGLEFGLFKNRIFGELTYYNKVTKGLYAPNQLSFIGSGLGGGSVQNVNAGTMRNRGFEYVINFEVIRKRDVLWSFNVNGAINNNKIVDLGTATEFAQGTGLVKVGQSLGDHYEIKWAGVDASSGAPLYYKQDGTLTSDNTQAFRFQDYGTWIPKYTGGFGTNLRYKKFDLSASFSYAAETYRTNNLEFFVENPSFLAGGFNQARSLNFWSKPGDIASTQSPAFQNQFSSKYIQDASFLRLRNVTLAYTVDKQALSKVKFISNIRFYVQGQNLLTFTKWKGYDPEDDNNISLSEFPNPRAMTAGLEVTF
jgi:TonB-linked SusC/RagA family outer membrane protein